MVFDPSMLYRLRDGVYAPDLLTVAVAELDVFTWLAEREPVDAATVCAEWELADRPVDVMLTYLTALGLLERRGAAVTPTDLSREHLVAGSRYDLRPYFASLRERPGCRELLTVLRSDRPAHWASAGADVDGTSDASWAGRLDDPRFAERITAAMDARGRFLGPALARAVAELPMRRVLDIGGFPSPARSSSAPRWTRPPARCSPRGDRPTASANSASTPGWERWGVDSGRLGVYYNPHHSHLLFAKVIGPTSCQ